MKEQFINVFVEKMMDYLSLVIGEEATVGSPYLVSNDQPVSYDITGIIGITGAKKGSVYFSAPREFLSQLLVLQGETDTSEENLLDIAGEIANTISGNVRSEFGQHFMISVPMVMKGEIGNMHLPKDTRSYVVPISWKTYTPVLTVSMENS